MTASTQLRDIGVGADVEPCFELMRQLRPHLTDRSLFAAQMTRLKERGYRLFGAFRGDLLVGLAGYRIQENFVHGDFAYIDDLVTQDADRRRGVGSALIEAVVEAARRENCANVVLDTNLSNRAAQSLYAHCGFSTVALHLVRELNVGGPTRAKL